VKINAQDMKTWVHEFTEIGDQKLQFIRAEIAAGRYEIQAHTIASKLMDQVHHLRDEFCNATNILVEAQ